MITSWSTCLSQVRSKDILNNLKDKFIEQERDLLIYIFCFLNCKFEQSNTTVSKNKIAY